MNLVASEEQYPDLANPVQMSFDTKGRLWVAVVPMYPHWRPKDPQNDKLLIFDLNDGKADKQTVFADNLNMPTGFEFFKRRRAGRDLARCAVPEGHHRRRSRATIPSASSKAWAWPTRTTRITASSSIRAALLLPGGHVQSHARRDPVRPNSLR